MSSYLKPQSPLYNNKEDAFFYPLTTSDQVILSDGSRLDSIFDATSYDDGKFLRIVNGRPAWVTIPNAEEATF